MVNMIKNPSAVTARFIEDLLIKEENTDKLLYKAGYACLAKLVSSIAFPIILAGELLFKRTPILFKTIQRGDQQKIDHQLDKIKKFLLGIAASPLGIRSTDSVSGLFLKSETSNFEIRPFGVEEKYGKTLKEPILFPQTVEELQSIVKKAISQKKQISIIGAGMSQGKQTVPNNDQTIVIHMKNLNKISFSEDAHTTTVQAGATWEHVQIAANLKGKSVIVKQASDIFSIGGSIGINCHGWAHEYGSIASTVESLDVIDANGELRTLTPQDELFGCMFGTLGYFGIVVSAKLKLIDNIYVKEKTEEVELDHFVQKYQSEIKNKNIPLFGGRLTIDSLMKNPLRKAYMVQYEKVDPPLGITEPVITPNFKMEPKIGTRVQRIALQALSHLPHYLSEILINRFWSEEKKAMLKGKILTLNEALHPPIKAFKIFQHSKLHTQWLQEYFVKPENLPAFLRFLGDQLKTNRVRLLNATIRPTPKDSISILPYAEQDRYAVVISFDQVKTHNKIHRTKQWMKAVNNYLLENGDVYYQAYMPFVPRADFEKCYGIERITHMRRLKKKYDPNNVFQNGHTAKYFEINK